MGRILSQCMSNHYNVHFENLTVLFASYISIKLKFKKGVKFKYEKRDEQYWVSFKNSIFKAKSVLYRMVHKHQLKYEAFLFIVLKSYLFFVAFSLSVNVLCSVDRVKVPSTRVCEQPGQKRPLQTITTSWCAQKTSAPLPFLLFSLFFQGLC